MPKTLTNPIFNLPTPSNINYMWNFGSLLGMCLLIQILSGLFLSFHYTNDISLAFSSVSHIMRDVNNGWLIRLIHANGASLFFIMIYLHIGRNMYYKSYLLTMPWLSGITILLILMATAFLGYVLPWGQMSFWGATVITNLLSAIPYIGNTITFWIWGGFSINNATLTRFFSLHFILPFILAFLACIHIIFLHTTGSSNPLGTPLNMDKIFFNPYFMWKDILGMLLVMFMFLSIMLMSPNLFMDPENFMEANPLITPIHIQPEWYFLFAYAILRSIPNKLGGVIGLIMSIVILASLPMSMKIKYKYPKYNMVYTISFWSLVMSFLILTFLGSCPIEPPFLHLSILFTLNYFSFFILTPLF